MFLTESLYVCEQNNLRTIKQRVMKLVRDRCTIKTLDRFVFQGCRPHFQTPECHKSNILCNVNKVLVGVASVGMADSN